MLVLTGAMGMMVTLVCVDGTIGDVCVCVVCKYMMMMHVIVVCVCVNTAT